MKAAIYARYSSDMQRPQSIEDQTRVCRELAERMGAQVVATYSDAAASGTQLMRQGLQGLLECVRTGRVTLVLSEALDRLSRDLEDVAAIHKLVSFHGAMIHTVSEGPISELHVGLNGTMNALFLKQLAEKTHRGLRGRIEAGKSGGGRCFGYALKAGAPGEREIEPSEAAVILRIFKDYSVGISPRAIAVALNADGVPGPRGGAWDQSTINGNRQRGTGILNNELYVGRLVWNRQRFVRDPQTRRRIARPNDAAAQVVTEIPELRIVPDELWQAVKARQESCSRPTQPGRVHGVHGYWEARRPRHLLSGLLTCGCCGAGMVLIGKTYYGCAAARNKGTCSNRLTVRRDRVEEAVLSGLQKHLVTPALTQEFIRTYQDAVNQSRADYEAERAREKRELDQVERSITNIVSAIKAGMFHISLKEELDALEQRKAALNAAHALPPPSPIRLHPNLAEVFEAKIGSLVEALNRQEDRAEAADLLRSLLGEIRLVPTEQGYQLDLSGDLAELLDFAASTGNEKRPAADATRRSGKLVAGARNLRFLHFDVAVLSPHGHRVSCR